MEINSGDTAWVLTSAALVMFMTPGVAFFYGGMVRAKAVLNMMMMCFGAMATIGVLWVLYGYSIAFGNSYGGIIGNPTEFLGLQGLMSESSVAGSIPSLAFVAFQAMFAIIATALIAGGIADRAKFSTWLVFTAIWGTVVYFPIAHWVFAFDSEDGTVRGGWIANQIHALDFAGGTAIHINAGAAALALVLVIGNRHGFGKEPMRPHNLTLVMLGAAMLWFGWFGFNAGSAGAANTTAAVAFINTLAATAAAILGWLLVERIRDGHATSLGAASGIVAGLVGITPAADSVSPLGAIVIGAIAGACCALAVSLKNKFNYDDSLDVVGVHLVGGLVGTLLIGFLATANAPAGVNGLFYGGGFDQLWRQAVGAFSVLIVSFVLSYAIGWVLHKTMGFRIDHDQELEGIDRHEHAESAYELLGQPGVRSMSMAYTRSSLASGDLSAGPATSDKGAVSS
ncbi:Amt family ammonium transporter [Kineosphaera limosa]|uniref:Ammonium transporter n=1 Tax=Kineosphaera limosa NBRC 100340 TaxID=1184609 RepID=K6W5X0_9MICO|nr:ammonium transporter [Kineosphaera limosa]NYD99443.1 Amt family ammonium transporter [Kineosphaera limosa]GAB94575.1 ammonium transporter [Kineosphaera limosa NBRC 100340]